MFSGVVGSEIVKAGDDGLGATILGTESANLQAYWPMDDVSGVLQDVSGNGRDLTIIGDPTYGITGQRGRAVQFDSNDGAFNDSEVGTTWLGPSAAWTVLLLANQDVSGTSALWSVGDDTQLNDYIIYNAIIAPDRLRLSARQGTAAFREIVALPAGWFMVVGRYDGSANPDLIRMRLYDGGSSAADDTQGSTQIDQSATTLDRFALNYWYRAGANSQFGQFTYQHGAVWNTELTNTQLDSIATRAGLLT